MQCGIVKLKDYDLGGYLFVYDVAQRRQCWFDIRGFDYRIFKVKDAVY